MIYAGLSDKQAAYIVFRAYKQQRDYGLTNKSEVPKVPVLTYQVKQKETMELKQDIIEKMVTAIGLKIVGIENLTDLR